MVFYLAWCHPYMATHLPGWLALGLLALAASLRSHPSLLPTLVCRGMRNLKPPLARAPALDAGAEQDEDVKAEEQRMHDLLQHRTGGRMGTSEANRPCSLWHAVHAVRESLIACG